MTLANLLPGLRELRTPLIIGWTWLLALWIAFSDIVPTREQSTGLARNVYDAASILGDFAVLGIFAFIAYLLGSLVEINISRLPWSPDDLVHLGFISFLSHKAETLARMRPKVPPYRLLADQIGHPYTSSTSYDDLQLGCETARQILKQPRQLENRLLAEKREVFDYYDRLTESAQLRINLAIAAFVLGTTVGYRLSAEGRPTEILSAAAVVTALLALALLLRGWEQLRRSRVALLTAVITGVVKSPILEEWEAKVGFAAAVSEDEDMRPDD